MSLDGPVARGDRCVLEFAGMFFQVSPAGGRVTSARVGERELVTASSVNALNYGSTFWTSPQSDWKWPPVVEVDSADFSLTTDDCSCTLVGPVVTSVADSSVSGIRVKKKFTADFARRAIAVDYTIENTTAANKRLAPWEITRVAAGGLSFFASDAQAEKTPYFPLPSTTLAAGCVWFRHDASAVESKLNGDGNGWIAHLTPENLLLIKAFPDILPSQAAHGEAEVQIYAKASSAAPNSYVEVENQGAYANIPAGHSLDWSVRWYLRALPAAIAPVAGNPELVNFVRETLR